ncbi:MAG: ATP-dependent DNA helicase RecG, partial [Flammeovirgaceae bacterium]
MSFFDTSIEFLKGVGPQRAALFQKELNIFTFGDLIQHYPFRYEDRTRFYQVTDINETMPSVQLKGRITEFEVVGAGNRKRLVGYFTDGVGELELVWFQGINWVLQKVKPQQEYIVFGKPNRYGTTLSIAHPEIDIVTEKKEKGGYL